MSDVSVDSEGHQQAPDGVPTHIIYANATTYCGAELYDPTSTFDFYPVHRFFFCILPPRTILAACDKYGSKVVVGAMITS